MVRPLGAKDKVRRKFLHSFARQYLHDWNIKIFKGDEQILGPVGQRLFKIKVPNTRYYVGEQFVKKGDTRKIYKFEELKDLGFVIISVSISPRQRWKTSQRVQYELRRVMETGEHINKIPKDHYVEYDAYNKVVRLVGPSAGPLNYGPFVRIERKGNFREGSGRKVKISNFSENADRIISRVHAQWRGEEEKPKPVYIKEAAFMITDSNEIVCFPNTADMPCILITGVRGSGKCILQDSSEDYIVDGLGRMIKIKDNPRKVIVLNKDLKLEKAKVKGIESRKTNRALKITTRNGYDIKVTPEHPLLTVLGWKKAEEFRVGDFIAVPRRYDLKLNKTMPKQEIAFLAYILAIGDTRYKKIKLRFHRKEIPIMGHIESCLKYFDEDIKFYSREIKSKKRPNPFKLFLEKYDLYGKHKSDMVIANEIMELSNGCIRYFLSIYYSVKGNVFRKQPRFVSDSKLMAKQIKHLLLRFGITSFMAAAKRKYRKKCIVNHELFIADLDSRKKVVKMLKPIQKYKQKKLSYILLEEDKKSSGIGNRDVIPSDIWKIAQLEDWFPACRKLGYYLKRSQVEKGEFSPSRVTFSKIAETTDNPTIKKIAGSDILWEKIKSIEKIKGEFTVWDIEVDHPAHNFVANDVIVHNSFCLHSILDRFFWKPSYNYKIAILNDSSREAGTWCLPNNDKDQINMLKRLNEKPLPLPCVYLHPLVKEDYEKLYMGNVGFDVTIPFKEIVMKHKRYLNLKESSRYFTSIINDLAYCTNQSDAERVLDDLVLIHGIPQQTANKIRAEFDTLFDSKMTDISTQGQKYWSTSKNTEQIYNPLTACIHAGVLPILETDYVSNDPSMLSIYFSYFAGDLFMRQRQDPDFLEEQSEMLLVIDEAHNISKKGEKTGADMLLRRCVREGRPRRMGTLLATQRFNELPDVIKDQTGFLICFKNPGEANKICAQYNLGKHMVSMIKDLGKHQCLAYTTEHFIIYDSNGKRRRSKLNEVFIGKSLPPYSLHKAPKKGGKKK